MLKSLHIEKFRCFDTFNMSNLGRVNLLTGYNNGGKTTMLEAIEALCSPGRVDWLLSTIYRRGELIENDEEPEDYDITHFFYGHDAELGAQILMSGLSDTGSSRLSLSLESPDKDTLFRIDRLARSERRIKVYSAVVRWELPLQDAVEVNFPVVNERVNRRALRLVPQTEATDTPRSPVKFLTTNSYAQERITFWYERIQLTPEEEIVVQALRIVDPRIERIAPRATRRRITRPERRDFLIKYENVSRPLPIGTMGDGVWRILCIALGLSASLGGVLLIDEIDTGLHYSTLEKMWRFVYQAAKRLNVQVFATTHSGDCIRSLAAVADEVAVDGPDAITIQHIDCNKNKAVSFDRREVVVAAEQDIEVR